ncbi:hypothetical protein D3C80_570570 [compost metagenome]
MSVSRNREIMTGDNRPLLVGKHATHEKRRVIAGIYQASGSVGEIAGDIERQIVTSGKLTGIDKLGEC